MRELFLQIQESGPKMLQKLDCQASGEESMGNLQGLIVYVM